MKNKIIKILIRLFLIIICLIGVHTINSKWEKIVTGSMDSKSDNGDFVKQTFVIKDNTYDISSINDLRSDIINSYSQEYGLSMQETLDKIIDTYNGVDNYIFNNNDIYSKAETIIIGEHFFAFHNFTLLSGAYFIENNDTSRRIVINKPLAYKLFGSYEVAGLTIMYENKLLYIAGVVDDVEPFVDKALNNDIPRAYIMYDNYILDNKDTSINSYEFMYEESIDGLFENYIMENILCECGDDDEEIEEKKIIIYNENNRFSIFKVYDIVSDLIKGFDRENGCTITFWEKRAKLYSIILLCITLSIVYLFIGLIHEFIIDYKAFKNYLHDRTD